MYADSSTANNSATIELMEASFLREYMYPRQADSRCSKICKPDTPICCIHTSFCQADLLIPPNSDRKVAMLTQQHMKQQSHVIAT